MSDERFDAVVVGSGFGGSVMTYRLAEAGLRVCCLERGKAYPPGSFPRSPYGTSRNLWDPSAGLHGIFNLWEFSGLGALVASGLGGGSLLYSNILIRKDRATFVDTEDERWPIGYDDLEQHYERHEAMLRAEPYPLAETTPKTVALREAAATLGLEWFLPKLAVTFAPDGVTPVPGEPVLGEHANLHGRTRSTCRLCGECNIGCNFGSKYTLDFNYLSFAKLRHGAEIRTRCEVRSFAPRPGGGYEVEYVDHADAVEGAPPTPAPAARTIHADRLVLAAGTFGSTYLLLRNRAALPLLGDRLGSRFCGNGDLLTFATRTHVRGRDGRRPRVVEPGYGPVITSTIRVPDALDGGPGRGFYLQDGGYPELINWVAEAADQPGAAIRALRLAWRMIRLWLRLGGSSDIGADVSRFLGSASLSASTLPMFSMGRDTPNGLMRLGEGGLLEIDWSKDGSPVFEEIRHTARAVAEALDGTFNDNVPWWIGRVITVHPLGGCPMGESERDGVVDAFGRVFGYPGLVVADGSVMPGPTGPNPSDTIAALAHRFADRLIADAS
jgi:cholesterol oxidase